MSKKQKEIILSVCLTCTLNKAQNNNKLAGEKLAQKLIDKFKNTKNAKSIEEIEESDINNLTNHTH